MYIALLFTIEDNYSTRKVRGIIWLFIVHHNVQNEEQNVKKAVE